MKYIEYINGLIQKEIARHPVVAFGQNITRGSCLGGMTRDIEPKAPGIAINSTNAESTLTGVGFGLMLEEKSGIFFMKQLDFLLLGIDQLVNTYNNIRSASDQKQLGSFTIMPIIVDSGYQGPQSSFNNFADFCTIARIRGYTITNPYDAERIIPKYLVRSGLRIITVSQRLFREEVVPVPKPVAISKEDTVFQYQEGSNVTVVSCNFALPHALTLVQMLEKKGISVAFFNINSPAEFDADMIIKSTEATKRMVVLDDSKSDNLPGNVLLAHPKLAPLSLRLHHTREHRKNWLHPVSDEFVVPYDDIVEKVWKSL